MSVSNMSTEYYDYHPRIFISYSHDNEEHCEKVLAFAQRLRSNGFDAIIDRYVEGSPTQGWPRWMLNQLESADFIILICTKTYYNRFRGREDSVGGKGVNWEGCIITNELYDKKSSSQRFVPVFVNAPDTDHIPEPLRQFTTYEVNAGYEELVKFLCGSSGIDPAVLGPAPSLRSKTTNSRIISRSAHLLDSNRSNSTLPSGRLLASFAAPGGTMLVDDIAYIERSTDRQSRAAALKRCETIIIKGARQFGKSSLLNRYLSNCRSNGKKIVNIDFSRYEKKVVSDYGLFLTRLGADLSQRFNRNESFGCNFSEQFEFLDFLESNLLEKLDGPVVIAFDETDRISRQEYAEDFFSMIRMWHNDRADHMLTWNNVGLALVTCTERKLFIADPLRSPFNVGEQIILLPFKLEEIKQLNALNGAPLSTSECEYLHFLLGGHPFLTSEAFYKIVGPNPISFQLLVGNASRDDGPFGEHLRAMLSNIKMVEGLQQTLYEVINFQIASRTEDFYRLRGAGIVRREDDKVIFSTNLYLQFFRNLISMGNV